MDNFKFNIGERVYSKYDGTDNIFGYHWEISAYTVDGRRMQNGKPQYLIAGDFWFPESHFISQAELDAAKAAGIKVVALQDAHAARTAAEETAKKAKLKAALKQVNIKGVDILVLEHFKDIKQYCENYNLFGRWYNREQFLNAILGKFQNDGFDYDADLEDVGYGDPIGSISGVSQYYNWYIDIYDTANMTQEQLENAESETGDFEPGFFLEAKDGKIYFIYTNKD